MYLINYFPINYIDNNDNNNIILIIMQICS